MIAYLVGTPLIFNTRLVMMVNGVGYGVAVGTRTLAQLPKDQPASLHIYTHVKEDAIDLFGFSSLEEKNIFELLLSVSGVGPKTALLISDLGAQAIIKAVQTADVTLLSSVPRVGKKLAQKIIIELKSKLGTLEELYLGPQSQQERDVVDALEALGFSESDIQKAIRELDLTQDIEASVLIKQAIKILGASNR